MRLCSLVVFVDMNDAPLEGVGWGMNLGNFF